MSRYVNEQLNINEVLKAEFSVKNTGRFKMTCPNPNHRDSDGSFEVYGENRGGFCFGCNKAYWPIDIIMFSRGINYYQALKVAEDEYGAELPENEDEVKKVTKADKVRYDSIRGLKISTKKGLHNYCLALNAIAEENDGQYKEYCKMKGIETND